MSGVDRISELPESLLTKILLSLPMKDSVKTSVLSTRWKNQWLHVPVFELDHIRFEDREVIISFIDKYLQFNPELCVHKFMIKSTLLEIDGLRNRIGTAISRGVEHLDVKSSVYYLEEEGEYPFIDQMPRNLYTSETLVSLELSRSGLEDSGFVSLPCLRFLHLRKIRWVGAMTLEKLLEGCPVLEELTLLMDLFPEFEVREGKSVVTRVRSRSLKRFYVPRNCKISYAQRLEYVLEIDAPGLEYMSLQEDHFDRIVVKNLFSLFTVDLDVKFFVGPGNFDIEDVAKRDEIHNFLNGISSVRQMVISHKTVKTLDLYSEEGVIPKFNNLSCLEAVFLSASLRFLPTFLESFPKLKHLSLRVSYSAAKEVLELISVPQCFLSTLESVEIKGVFEWEAEEKKIAHYFLENSAVLKKFILSFPDRAYPLYVPESDVYEELSQLTKRSQGCRIIIDYER